MWETKVRQRLRYIFFYSSQSSAKIIILKIFKYGKRVQIETLSFSSSAVCPRPVPRLLLIVCDFFKIWETKVRPFPPDLQSIRKPSARLETRLADAEERRRAAEEEKVKKVMEHSGLEKHGRLKSASAARRENRYISTSGEKKVIRYKCGKCHFTLPVIRYKCVKSHFTLPVIRYKCGKSHVFTLPAIRCKCGKSHFFTLPAIKYKCGKSHFTFTIVLIEYECGKSHFTFTIVLTKYKCWKSHIPCRVPGPGTARRWPADRRSCRRCATS